LGREEALVNLSDLSLKKPVFATVIILALVSLGIVSYISLNINDLPDIDIPYVTVAIADPGVAPAQMETDVTKKVEDAVGQISGVQHITSYSDEGLSQVLIEFTLETPPDQATQNVRDKVGAIRGDLPQQIQEPVISKFDLNSQPIISLAVSGRLPLQEMTTLVEDVVKPRLEKIDGVGQITTYGEETREIQINLDKDKLAAYGITTTDVLNNLENQNMDVSGGQLSSGRNEVTIRTAGKIDNVEQFRDLPVARQNGTQLYVKDIADVEDGIKDQDSLARFDGQPAIGIDLAKQSDSNTVSVADEAKQAVAELKQQLPPGTAIDVVRDNSVDIRDSVNDVIRTIFEGSLLAILVVFLFLKDWRSTLISAVALPTSIISTFFIFKLLNYTLNTMTLLALSLAVGLLIDDAIVVIENISRHLKMGKRPLEAARDGTAEISTAVLATTLTIVAVFLPMSMMTGIIGRLFIPFAITVVFAVLVSLLVSFTLVPVLSSRYLNGERGSGEGWLNRFLSWFNGLFERLAGFYARLLALMLKNRLLTVVIVVALLVVSFMLVPRLGVTFIPDQDTGDLSIVANVDSGLNLSTVDGLDNQILSLLKTYPEVTETYSTIQTNQINVYVKLVDLSKRSRTDKQIASALRQDLNTLPGMQAAVDTASSMGGTSKAVTYELLGSDYDTLQAYAVKAQQIMASIPGAVDVGSSFKPGQPEVQVQIKQDAAADLGVSTAQVGDVLNTLFSGVVVGQYDDGGDSYDVRVRLGEGQRQNVEDLDNIYLQSEYGSSGGSPNLIPLSQVSERTFSTSPSELMRYDKQGDIELTANLEGISSGDFSSIFAGRVAQELRLPPGYQLFAAGTSEMQGESFSSIGIALVLGVLFMFFVLAAQFESFIDPFAIILSLPLAIIGAILGLLIGGSQISIMSLIGIIMLMGLVAKNAILLIDFAKAERKRGTERSESLIMAARIRFRPIMMTSLAMILGMTPLALKLGSGSELRAPMAHVIIGGLITSTLLTLVVVPVIYTLLDDIQGRLFRRPAGNLDQPGVAPSGPAPFSSSQ
jgi:HAE1 family hydrophobic/amphiphilic exporter-1